ncbi:hypothetical protein AQV86_03470 [Nanohaloarchaea archaeon SG9]|nr:hypothetical protein AQV86_03470 [Nanohaloarchaea archaeon SG9]
MTEKDWKVFQQDVLDVLRQYEGYFDFFERVGSLSDDSRPDSFARISREEKKEIWVLDAKNKAEINEDDEQRMEKYLEMAKSNPIDVGLQMSELSEYRIRGVFVTPQERPETDYEAVKFSELHQFLQKELIYNNISKLVRDLAKMAERKQLSQNQARLLFRSLKPFEDRLDEAMEKLEELEDKYVGLKLRKPPLSSFDFKVPVDAVLVHEEKGKAFLIDVPYSESEFENIEDKVGEVKDRMSGIDKEVYYTALDTFEGHDSEFVHELRDIEEEIQKTAGIVSPEELAELFTPKVSTEKRYEEDYIEVLDTEGLGFRLRVQTFDDVSHKVEVLLPEDASSRIKDRVMNSRKEFGTVDEGLLQQQVKVAEGPKINLSGQEKELSEYRSDVKSLYHPAVNPVLSKKVKKTAKKS